MTYIIKAEPTQIELRKVVKKKKNNGEQMDHNQNSIT